MVYASEEYFNIIYKIYIDAQVPFVLLFFSLLSGGNIVSDIIGIVAGHLYFYFKDIAPVSHQMNLLKTPQYL